jgi:hypothetical protein
MADYVPLTPADYSIAGMYKPRTVNGFPAAAPVSEYSSMASWGNPAPNYQLSAGGDGFGLRVDPNQFAPSVGASLGYGGYASPVAGTGPIGNSAPPVQVGPITQWLRDNGVIGYKAKDGTEQQGWGGLALGAATGLGQLYLGMQQYNLAKEALANSKSQFERNFANQVKTTNTNLEDRQRARVASNAGAYQSVGDYMAQNGVR